MLIVQRRFTRATYQTTDMIANNHLGEVLSSLMRIEARLQKACDMLAVIYDRTNGKQIVE
jgi:hypothetical protein